MNLLLTDNVAITQLQEEENTGNGRNQALGLTMSTSQSKVSLSQNTQAKEIHRILGAPMLYLKKDGYECTK